MTIGEFSVFFILLFGAFSAIAAYYYFYDTFRKKDNDEVYSNDREKVLNKWLFYTFFVVIPCSFIVDVFLYE